MLAGFGGGDAVCVLHSCPAGVRGVSCVSRSCCTSLPLTCPTCPPCLSLGPPTGHTNFSDELAASLRLSDGVLLVVDAVEGVMVGTERAVKAAAAEGLPICLLVSKMDRCVRACACVCAGGAAGGDTGAGCRVQGVGSIRGGIDAMAMRCDAECACVCVHPPTHPHTGCRWS